MASIRDIARISGVSQATVSRVLNGTANVDEEKRQRVEKAIHETGYKPNLVARSLFKKSAHIIGVVVPNIENPFFNEMARAIEDEAYNNGYRLTLCSSNENPEKEKNNIDLLERMNADGIILMTNEEAIFEKLSSSRIPVVVLDRETTQGREIASLRGDHYNGGKLAMEHLLACGCRHIVLMRGPQNLSSGRQRFYGYLDVCREHQVVPAYVDCSYSYTEGLKQTEELLQKYPDTDGIIATNDLVAISAYKVLSRHGIRVPGDIQLIGFDNIDFSKLVTPELTTVAQPIAEIGTSAVRILLDHIAGKEIRKEYVFPVRLIERETTEKIRTEK